MNSLLKIDDVEFLSELRQGDIGRSITTKRLTAERRDREQAAAEILQAESSAASEHANIDCQLTAENKEISKLAEMLLCAQNRHGALMQKKNEIEDRRFSIVKNAQEVLERTAPPELLNFIKFAFRVELSAIFQLGGGSGSCHTPKKEADLQAARPLLLALLPRAKAAHLKALSLIRKPDVSVSDVQALRAELNAPAQYDEA
jgi:hypothetical protein